MQARICGGLGWATTQVYPAHWLTWTPLADMYLTLADDNYAVRVAYVRATGERLGRVSLLTRPRHQVERALAQARTKNQD